jgi:hypothetical protein
MTCSIVSYGIAFLVWNPYGSQREYESALQHQMLHIFMEFYSEFECEVAIIRCLKADSYFC